MKSRLLACLSCARHVRVDEPCCPFCGAVHFAPRVATPSLPPRRRTRAELYAYGTVGALAVAACGRLAPAGSSDAGSNDDVAASDTGTSDDAGAGTDAPESDDAVENRDVGEDRDAVVSSDVGPPEMDGFVAVLYGGAPCPDGEVIVDDDAATLNPNRCALCPPCGEPTPQDA